ncbi:2-hydroxychromene-2-carboxylate isomerase [Emcibacter nanhaiensis]|uniref:2-hydroxychromene-2-carboxylate isomerase n=1 Tax=Emcibacter nanhaiensis TaxID=1505037 RepID=A0A501PN92_9PROT|nr:2-hydroxychromene-2-carboxylate isomerase [Emcibacter nanhaiensis]TPD61970.1 2-hydroxychromene-2-carboxylate isomerase [Emcibacter nanhaiensis]
MEKHTLDFWYEFASTYSYLAAERIEPLARKKGVTVNWRPFLLGPIFHAQGWNSSPFKIYKVKGDYMWRDMERLAERYGLPFRIPVANELPQHSVLAARVALCLPDDGPRADFSRRVYRAEWTADKCISDPEVITAILEEMGLEAPALLDRATTPDIKQALKDNMDEAIAKGVFGAPSFTTPDGELFWGDDRLEQALEWVANH